MALVTLAAVGLLLVGVVALLASIVTAGRPEGHVLVPAELLDRGRGMRARAHARVVAGAGAAVVGGVVGLVGVMASDGATSDWGQVVWVVAFLMGAGAGCVVVALFGPRRQSVTGLRSADLTPRTAGSFGPRWALIAPALLAGLLVVVMIATAMTATEVGGSGALMWSDDAAVGSVGPYPSWSIVLPLLVLLLGAGAAFVLALHRIAGWPRPTERGLFGLDDDIRRSTTRMLLFGTAGALFAALGAFGYQVARTWGVAQVNQRINATPASADPAPVETMWSFLTFTAAGFLVVGFVLMACAPLAGRVRRPQIEQRVAAPGPAVVGE